MREAKKRKQKKGSKGKEARENEGWGEGGKDPRF
jgi:hypothetical protein